MLCNVFGFFRGANVIAPARGEVRQKKALAKFTRVLKCLDFLRALYEAGKKVAYWEKN